MARPPPGIELNRGSAPAYCCRRPVEPIMDPMLGFMIKKAFFDSWDHLLPIMGLNLLFLVLIAIPFSAAPLMAAVTEPGAAVVFAIGLLVLFVYAGAVSEVICAATDYHSIELRELLAAIRRSYLGSLAFGAVFLLHLVVLAVSIPVYFAMEHMLGLFALVVLFWVSVIWWLSCQFYFPIRSRLGDKPIKALKKCFLVFFDNPGFTVFTGMGSLLLIVGSYLMPLFLLIPGPTGLLVWVHVGFKLRLYKYDYIEQHPGPRRQRIPWTALLSEEREKVGPRTLRGMIFPWKE